MIYFPFNSIHRVSSIIFSAFNICLFIQFFFTFPKIPISYQQSISESKYHEMYETYFQKYFNRSQKNLSFTYLFLELFLAFFLENQTTFKYRYIPKIAPFDDLFNFINIHKKFNKSQQIFWNMFVRDIITSFI